MDKKNDSNLKKAYSFESWYGSNKLNEDLFVLNFSLQKSNFPDWDAHRIQRLDINDGRYHTTSIWKHKDKRAESFFKVDVFECKSRTEAHKYLLQLLGEFQLPISEQQEQIEVGDIAFDILKDTNLLFARANLVFFVRNVGREPMPVTKTVLNLDRDLVNKPEILELESALHMVKMSSPENNIKPGDQIPLKIKETEKTGPQPLYKFFSNTGEILLKDKELVYTPQSLGNQVVDFFKINEGNKSIYQKLIVDI